MSERARFTDMLGIESSDGDSESFWPLNVVLLALGAAILGVAFYFLDPRDPRLVYNPWTYAVATPIVLLAFSALLSTVVSRVVEKSMQLAFLLSVLIHLGLLVCAVNVEIFSRMWPDVLDSLAQHREQVKRESLQAKQYHRVSITTQSGRRPDYLTHVHTEHQPTELEKTEAPTLALARSQHVNLVSPSPKIELAHTPHLLERAKSVTTLPSSSEQTATLSRSELHLPTQSPSSVPTAPEPLQLESNPPVPLVQPLESHAAINVRRQNDSRSADSRTTALQPTQPPLPPATASIPPLPPRQTQWHVPSTSLGDAPMTIARDTAGGRVGSSAPHSMPVQGIGDFGAPIQSSTARLESAPQARAQRRTTSQRTASQWPELGTLQGLAWNGETSLSSGIAGRSPSQVAQQESEGSASVEDVAGLSGAGRRLEKSMMGLDTIPHPLASPGSVGDLDERVPPAPSAESSPSLAASSTDIERATLSHNPLELESSAMLAPPISSDETNIETSVKLMRAREERGTASDASPNIAEASESLRRSDAWATKAPGTGEISIPEFGPTATPGEIAQTASPWSQLSRANDHSPTTPPLSTPLDIEQPEGQGGVAPQLNATGPLLARRDAPTMQWMPPQIDSQRFARQDVGGQLAAGRDIVVPKPAFQQRIDRLKDRLPQDESSLEPQTELAIERGLAFLAKHQRPDGSWRLQDFDTKVLMRSDTAATALALLAFQGAGYTHQQFKYSSTVDKAVQFLARHQARNGDLYIPQDPASDQNAWLYSHAIASLALCEAFGMTQDDALRPTAQRAIDFMVASQDPLRGGWRYRPGSGADTSVTGWFMMAFKSGQLAGLDVPQGTFQTIEKYLAASQASDAEPHLYRYNPFAADTAQQRHGLQPTSVMTSVGLLMRLYFGWRRDRPEMIAGADHLLENLPEHGTPSLSRRDTYYWYYATQVMFHMRGQRWQRWRDQLYPLLISSQVTQGSQEGSWDPNYPTPDLWARYGGRLYVTTMNLLSLEVSYRHLPLYEATAQ